MKMPEKPKTQKEQISTIWDILNNHVLSGLRWQNTKLTFIFALLGLILAFLGIVIIRG